MREVDRLMVEEIGITVPMMMENAGRNIAVLCRRLLGGSVMNKLIVILCGKGNNGGDGLAAGRHLVNYGALVEIYLSHAPRELNENTKLQYGVLKKSQIPMYEFPTCETSQLQNSLEKADYVLDGLLGYSVKGDPREPIATLIKIANDSRKPILAIDLPSGLDPDRGVPCSPTIEAQATLTLALPKTGLLKSRAKEFVGRLFLANLSVPKVVYEKLGLSVPLLFEKDEVIGPIN